jgi:ATP-dependent Zn protease
MTTIAQTLDKKLGLWSHHTAVQVEQMVQDIIELADADALDLLPSRTVEHETLTLLDESQTR